MMVYRWALSIYYVYPRIVQNEECICQHQHGAVVTAADV